MDKAQIILHIHHPVNYTLYDTKWIPRSAKFIALGNHAKGTGALDIFEIDHGKLNVIQQSVKAKALKCGTFGASTYQNRAIATGDFDGNLQIWDIECLQTPIYKAKAHKSIVNCVDGVGGLAVGEGAAEIVTGSRDGSVKVWDARQKEEPVAIFEPVEGGESRDCWAVAFGHSYNKHDRCVASGYDNGDIKLFDLRNMSLRWECNVKNGVCGLQFDRKDISINKLVATCLEGKLHVFDMRTQHPKLGFESLTQKAHKSTIWGVSHVPQNRDLFITMAGNGSLNLWKYNYPSKRVSTDTDGLKKGVVGYLTSLQNLTLSSQPISSFDWNADKLGLGVCSSFDQSLRVLIVTKLNLF